MVLLVDNDGAGFLGTELQHPRAVALLIARMIFRIIRGVRPPHLPQDFQPPLGQTTQRAGMALARLPLGRVIGGRPRAGLPTAVGPEMDGVPQMPVAVPPDFHPPGHG